MTITIEEIIGPQLVKLDLEAGDKWDAIEQMAALMSADGRLSDPPTYVAAVREREEQTPTGMEMGIAIPHARSGAVTKPALAFARSRAGIEFGASDGTPADLLFLIAAPEGAGDVHLTILSRIARKLVHEDFRTSLREAASPEEVVGIFKKEIEI